MTKKEEKSKVRYDKNYKIENLLLTEKQKISEELAGKCYRHIVHLPNDRYVVVEGSHRKTRPKYSKVYRMKPYNITGEVSNNSEAESDGDREIIIGTITI